jgi:hypothetical protein
MHFDDTDQGTIPQMSKNVFGSFLMVTLSALGSLLQQTIIFSFFKSHTLCGHHMKKPFFCLLFYLAPCS